MSYSEPTLNDSKRMLAEIGKLERWIRDKAALRAILAEHVVEEEDTIVSWQEWWKNTCALYIKLEAHWHNELLGGRSRQALRAMLIAQEHMML